jgi:hypothetical protein
MRFFIAGEICLEEVIGEPVTFPQIPDEVFAVHRPHIGEPDPLCYWYVSHVETGAKVGMGDSIDFAIEVAQRAIASKTADEIKAALETARERIVDARAKLPIGPIIFDVPA